MVVTSSSPAPVDLAGSYAYCRRVARSRGRNFYYSFKALTPEKHAAMCSVYAFFRLADDISDEGGSEAAARMADLRRMLTRALEGDTAGHPILPALAETVARYAIPHPYFFDLMDGTESDLTHVPFQSFDQTYRYCFQVASTVGLVCIHIWGFQDEKALKLAEWNGIAFQLTNILRDLREDAALGRLYLPAEDFRRFDYEPRGLAAGLENESFRRLMQFQVERARDYYARSSPLAALIDPDARPCLLAMRQIYGGILDCMVRRNYAVLSHRARVPGWRKVMIAATAWQSARRARHAAGISQSAGKEREVVRIEGP